MIAFRQILVLFLAVLTGSVPALAGEVLRVNQGSHSAAISVDSGQSYFAGDRVCVRHDQSLSCGKVIRAARRAAIVKFDTAMTISVGDPVKPYDPERDVASGESESSMEAKLRRLKVKEGTYSDIQGPPFNVTFGIDMIYPGISFSWAPVHWCVIALRGYYYETLTDNVSGDLLGGGLTISGYTEQAYKGVWFQLGGGYGSGNLSVPTGLDTKITDKRPVVELITTLGYRWLWETGLNIGVATGVRYFSFSHSDTLRLQASVLMPVLQLEGGFAF